MKSLTVYALTFMAFIGTISCGPSYTKPVEASQTGFAISFFKNVNEVTPKDENVVVSPYSAAVALSMLAEGAQGQTRVEFDNALDGVLYKAEDLGSNDSVVVKSANSVWIDDNFSPRNRYVNLLEKDFDAFLDVLNFADPATLKQIEAKNLVVFRYANADGSLAEEFPANPNGSLNSIAGICDETGRVFGLMPHPEAFLSPYNSPTWTADQLKGELPKEGDGVAIFRNAVEYLA